MRKLYTFFATLGLALSAFADGPVVQTTAFTRLFLHVPDAPSAWVVLQLYPSNNVLVTNYVPTRIAFTNAGVIWSFNSDGSFTMTNTVTTANGKFGTNGHARFLDQFGDVREWTTNSFIVQIPTGTLQLSNGVVTLNGSPLGVLSSNQNWTGVNTFSNIGNIFYGSYFIGDGSQLTGVTVVLSNLPASIAMLSSNAGVVKLLHADGSFTNFYGANDTNRGNALWSAYSLSTNHDSLYAGPGNFFLTNNQTIDLSLGGTGTVNLIGAGSGLTTIIGHNNSALLINASTNGLVQGITLTDYLIYNQTCQIVMLNGPSYGDQFVDVAIVGGSDGILARSGYPVVNFLGYNCSLQAQWQCFGEGSNSTKKTGGHYTWCTNDSFTFINTVFLVNSSITNTDVTASNEVKVVESYGGNLRLLNCSIIATNNKPYSASSTNAAIKVGLFGNVEIGAGTRVYSGSTNASLSSYDVVNLGGNTTVVADASAVYDATKVSGPSVTKLNMYGATPPTNSAGGTGGTSNAIANLNGSGTNTFLLSPTLAITKTNIDWGYNPIILTGFTNSKDNGVYYSDTNQSDPVWSFWDPIYSCASNGIYCIWTNSSTPWDQSNVCIIQLNPYICWWLKLTNYSSLSPAIYILQCTNWDDAMHNFYVNPILTGPTPVGRWIIDNWPDYTTNGVYGSGTGSTTNVTQYTLFQDGYRPLVGVLPITETETNYVFIHALGHKPSFVQWCWICLHDDTNTGIKAGAERPIAMRAAEIWDWGDFENDENTAALRLVIPVSGFVEFENFKTRIFTSPTSGTNFGFEVRVWP